MISKLNNLLHDPSYYSFNLDFPEKNSLPSRIFYASLPFLTLYKPFGKITTLTTDSLRAVSYSYNLLYNPQENPIDRNTQLFNVAAAITALAGTIFAHPLGLFVISATEITKHTALMMFELNRREYSQALKTFTAVIEHLLYCATMTMGSIEVIALSTLLNMTKELIRSKKEFKEGDFIEAISHLLMSAVRLTQAAPLVKEVGSIHFKRSIPLTPSDWMIYRCFQMVLQGGYQTLDAMNGVTEVKPTREQLEKKLNNYKDYFESNGQIPIQEALTPREYHLLKTEFKDLNEAEGLNLAREAVRKEIPEGVSIFVTSRLTYWLMQGYRFNVAEMFRYIGGRDMKHTGFLIKENDQLSISHVSPVFELKTKTDPLTFAYSIILQCNPRLIKPDLSVEEENAFYTNLKNRVLTQDKQLFNMGSFVFVPFFLGHTRYLPIGTPSSIEFKDGTREMCSSFVVKILLQTFKEIGVENLVPKKEILEWIDIVRFFRFFYDCLEEKRFDNLIVNAFPSPTFSIRRFFKKEIEE
jgi:hypothetical protein